MSPELQARINAAIANGKRKSDEEWALGFVASTRKSDRAKEVEDAMDKRIENLEALRELAGYDYEAALHAQDHKRMKTALRELITLDNQIEAATAKRAKAHSLLYA